jgi:hypothetical protein
MWNGVHPSHYRVCEYPSCAHYGASERQQQSRLEPGLLFYWEMGLEDTKLRRLQRKKFWRPSRVRVGGALG